MYNPHTGRFLQADTYAGHLSDPLSLNLYTYCLNNPTRYVDPSGHFAISAILLTALVGAGMEVGIQLIQNGGNFKKISWKDVAWEAGAGFAIGALTAGWGTAEAAAARAALNEQTLGRIGERALISAVKKISRTTGQRVAGTALFASATNMVINSGHELLNQRKITTSGLAYSAVSGAISGIIGEVVPAVLRKVKVNKLEKRRYAEYWRRVAAGKTGHPGMSDAEYAKWLTATAHLDAELAYGRVDYDELLELRKSEVGSVACQGGKYSEIEIKNIIDNLQGDGFKTNPLRMAYEQEVADLASYSEELMRGGYSAEETAKMLNQARRDLGIKYKNMTPQPLRDYIYEINIKRYGDKLGPTYDYLTKVKMKTDLEIISSSSTPNSNIDKLLGGFEEWLRKQ